MAHKTASHSKMLWCVMGALCVIALVAFTACVRSSGGFNTREQLDWHGVAHLTKSISYCDDQEHYPNTNFDLYQSSAKTNAQPHPVFIYVHGGGYTVGSKNTQDLSCMGPGVEALFEQLLAKGCDVVSMDYTLAPDGIYPQPVLELAALVNHLREHAHEYELDMDRIALGGGSAGGQIAGQYAALATDEVYRESFVADNLGDKPQRSEYERVVAEELECDGLRAVYLGCALLEPVHFASTGDAETDEMFAQMQDAYFNPQDAVQYEHNLAEADVTGHVTKCFPATFVTDGNHVTFTDQAQRLDAKLSKLGIEHEACIFASDYKKQISHGYDVQDCPEAYETAGRAAAFILKQL